MLSGALRLACYPPSVTWHTSACLVLTPVSRWGERSSEWLSTVPQSYQEEAGREPAPRFPRCSTAPRGTAPRSWGIRPEPCSPGAQTHRTGSPGRLRRAWAGEGNDGAAASWEFQAGRAGRGCMQASGCAVHRGESGAPSPRESSGVPHQWQGLHTKRGPELREGART